VKRIVILGSTGSIGQQTLDIAAQFPDEVSVIGLAAHHDVDTLAEQGRRFPTAKLVTVSAEALPTDGISRGQDAMIDMACAPEVDLIVQAIVGSGGLSVTMRALREGKLIALANKEALVMAGPIIRSQLQHAGSLVPIDSEHSAIWQCLQGETNNAVDRVALTASGGAFRDFSEEELKTVTPRQALNHPIWTMGQKVTVDSATLMNKGLEVIEATLLFDLGMDQVDVLMHRESIIHSLVYFRDSSVKAQLGLPDMRLPIQYALTHPGRWPNDLSRLDLATIGSLTFGPVPTGRYPCLELALDAGRRGGTYPAVLCAADEVAVQLFLHGSIDFPSIPHLIARTLEQHVPVESPGLDDILEADEFGRQVCCKLAAALMA
jgi:1-deoxy-D-xylulose-5-phosphate reductoisomerase